jgi:sec-independent protein translocase protein TatB
MPQIGWLEILIVVVIAILIIGPKDFPFMIKKLGSLIGSFKNYFNEVQKDIIEIEQSAKDDMSLDENLTKKLEKKKNDQ